MRRFAVLALLALVAAVASVHAEPFVWQPTPSTSPLPSRSHSVGFSLPSQGDSLFVFGGQVGMAAGELQTFSDVQRSDDGGATWQRVGDFAPFGGRWGAVGVLTGNGDEILVTGGSEGETGFTSDIWSINDPTFAASSWNLISSGAFSPARINHCAVTYNGDSLMIFGGRTYDPAQGYVPIEDVWFSENGGLSFAKRPMIGHHWGANGGRYGMSCAASGFTVVMVGGSLGDQGTGNDVVTNEVWLTSDGGNFWSQASTAPTFAARAFAGPNLARVGDLYLFAGGLGAEGQLLSDVWYSPISSGEEWLRDSSSDAPFPARAAHSLIVANDKLYSVGGVKFDEAWQMPMETDEVFLYVDLNPTAPESSTGGEGEESSTGAEASTGDEGEPGSTGPSGDESSSAPAGGDDESSTGEEASSGPSDGEDGSSAPAGDESSTGAEASTGDEGEGSTGAAPGDDESSSAPSGGDDESSTAADGGDASSAPSGGDDDSSSAPSGGDESSTAPAPGDEDSTGPAGEESSTGSSDTGATGGPDDEGSSGDNQPIQGDSSTAGTGLSAANRVSVPFSLLLVAMLAAIVAAMQM